MRSIASDCDRLLVIAIDCVPHHQVTWTSNVVTVRAFLEGIPHALLLSSAEGDLFVLIPALAKPCLLADPSDPLSGQMVR